MAKDLAIPEITPHLNPAYWQRGGEGHSLGIGEAVFYESSGKQGDFIKDARYAKKILEAKVPSQGITPIHTFEPGTVFDPRNFYPGTVLLLAKERLRGTVLSKEEAAVAAVQPLPARLLDTFPCFDVRGTFMRDENTKRWYESSVCWGVVLPEGRSNPFLTISANRVGASGAGVKVLNLYFTPEQAPVTIGETVHHRWSAGYEGLDRVNALHVIAEGTPQRSRKRQKVFSLLPGLISRPVSGLS